MTKGKIFLSAILLVLLLNITPVASAAEGDAGKLTMTASRTSVSHGEAVQVTITSNMAFQTRGAGITVAYDADALVPENCTAAAPFVVSGPMKLGSSTVMRISFVPGQESYSVSDKAPLATLTFRTKTPGDDIKVKMTAAYLYDTNLQDVGLQIADPIQFQVAPVPVSEVKLKYESLTMEIGTPLRLTAEVLPENASDKTVAWTSSAPEIIRVDENGLLTALEATDTPVIITAASGGCTAQCSVTAAYPPNVGYVVSVPGQGGCRVDETVQIPLTVTSTLTEDGSGQLQVNKFNAFDIILTYDPAKLDLIGVDPPAGTDNRNLTIVNRNGSVQILSYGDVQLFDGEAGANAFTLNFKALKTGNSYLEIQDNARVDHSANAVEYNTSKAARKPDEYRTLVSVNGFTVALPTGFEGEMPVAQSDEPYRFWDLDEDTLYYEYTFSGTMGPEELTASMVLRNSDGSFTIDPVTGNLIVLVEKTGKRYTVTLKDNFDNGRPDITGQDHARFAEDYSFTVADVDDLDFTVTIGGVKMNKNSLNRMGDTYTIPGGMIRGDIMIETSEYKDPGYTPPTTGKKVIITFEGSGKDDVLADSREAVKGGKYSFQLNKDEAYRYTVTYLSTDGTVTAIRPDSNGVYTIKKVPSDITVTVSKDRKESPQTVDLEVAEYLHLPSDRIMYLLLVPNLLDDSEYYTYEETPMIYSEVYGKWCVLTVKSNILDKETFRAQAIGKLDAHKGARTVMETSDPDVNRSMHVDINDAQLVYNMYKGRHDELNTSNMRNYLNADLNKDKKIDVQDAAGVVHAIQ